jgi:RNA polymerase sigma factor (TIGR02999 family)
MNNVTQLLEAAAHGDRQAAAELMPAVYDELRRLAAARLACENPGQTLDSTALVHEAYLRLVGNQQFDHRGHFFAAAAEAMRRILVDRAREKATAKRGGGKLRVDLDQIACDVTGEHPADELLALDEALTELGRHDPLAAQLVNLRYFAGLSHQQAADALGIGRRAADRVWALARAWLFQQLNDS